MQTNRSVRNLNSHSTILEILVINTFALAVSGFKCDLFCKVLILAAEIAQIIIWRITFSYKNDDDF